MNYRLSSLFLDHPTSFGLPAVSAIPLTAPRATLSEYLSLYIYTIK